MKLDPPSGSNGAWRMGKEQEACLWCSSVSCPVGNGRSSHQSLRACGDCRHSTVIQ